MKWNFKCIIQINAWIFSFALSYLVKLLLDFCCCSVTCVWLFVTPQKADTRFPVLHISQSLLKLMTIESMSFKHLTHCRPLFLLSSIFSSELALHIRWPKHWSFSFSINPSNEHSGLISFRTDWFDLLAVQGSFKSLLQHHNLKH